MQTWMTCSNTTCPFWVTPHVWFGLQFRNHTRRFCVPLHAAPHTRVLCGLTALHCIRWMCRARYLPTATRPPYCLTRTPFRSLPRPISFLACTPCRAQPLPRLPATTAGYRMPSSHRLQMNSPATPAHVSTYTAGLAPCQYTACACYPTHTAPHCGLSFTTAFPITHRGPLHALLLPAPYHPRVLKRAHAVRCTYAFTLPCLPRSYLYHPTYTRLVPQFIIPVRYTAVTGVA